MVHGTDANPPAAHTSGVGEHGFDFPRFEAVEKGACGWVSHFLREAAAGLGGVAGDFRTRA